MRVTEGREFCTKLFAGTKHAERKASTVVQRTNKVCESGLLGSVYYSVLSRPRTKTSKLRWWKKLKLEILRNSPCEVLLVWQKFSLQIRNCERCRHLQSNLKKCARKAQSAIVPNTQLGLQWKILQHLSHALDAWQLDDNIVCSTKLCIC